MSDMTGCRSLMAVKAHHEIQEWMTSTMRARPMRINTAPRPSRCKKFILIMKFGLIKIMITVPSIQNE